MSALSEVMRTVIAREHQASFRISNFRMTHMVDVAPTQLTAENYLQMLIAEADHLHHGTMTKASPTSGNPKINVVNAAGDKGGGKKGSPGKKGNGNNAEGSGYGAGTGACKHWGKPHECLKGDKCTYVHEWNNLNGKEKRCWKCSSLEHIAKDCTAGDKVMTSPGDRTSKGSPKGKGKTKDGKNDKGKGKDRDKPVGGVDQSSKDSQPQVAQIQPSNLKLPRYNSNLKLLRYNSNLKLPRHNSNLKLLKYNSSLKLLKYNNKLSPQSWVKLPVFSRQCEQRQRLQGCWRW